MRLPRFKYLEPETLERALDLLNTHGEACSILGGGTDLLVRMKKRLCQPAYLLSLKRLDELDGITRKNGWLTIGARTSLAAVAASRDVKKHLPALSRQNRDRTWWTKIHGRSWPHWHRKFPLPGWVDDRSYRLEFVFSDGEIFTVYDSRKMAMNPNGPKYRPEEHDETDPRKQHPKIGAATGAKPTWVKFRKV